MPRKAFSIHITDDEADDDESDDETPEWLATTALAATLAAVATVVAIDAVGTVADVAPDETAPTDVVLGVDELLLLPLLLLTLACRTHGWSSTTAKVAR